MFKLAAFSIEHLNWNREELFAGKIDQNSTCSHQQVLSQVKACIYPNKVNYKPINQFEYLKHFFAAV